MTLEEMVEDALLRGYDFSSLYNDLKNNKKDIQEYIEGYIISKDKESYLEAIADDDVIKCSKIYLYNDKIKEYLKKIESDKYTKIISGFQVRDEAYLEELYKDYSYCDPTVFRIISINEDKKTAYGKEIEYIDYGSSKVLSVYHADLNFKEVIEYISLNGENLIYLNIENTLYGLIPELEIELV